MIQPVPIITLIARKVNGDEGFSPVGPELGGVMTEEEINAEIVAMRLASHEFVPDMVMAYRADQYPSLAEARKEEGIVTSHSCETYGEFYDMEHGITMTADLCGYNIEVFVMDYKGYVLPFGLAMESMN